MLFGGKISKEMVDIIVASHRLGVVIPYAQLEQLRSDMKQLSDLNDKKIHKLNIKDALEKVAIRKLKEED